MSRSRPRRIILLAILLLLSTQAFSDPLEEGFVAFKQGDKELAYKNWLPLAIRGDARAQFFLSVLYENWTGGVEDKKNATRWLTASANNGFIPARFNLGNNYHQGRYGAVDNKMAAYWWEQAAVQGFVEAQYHLATIYYWGKGIQQDLKEALYWYQKAAKNGSQEAAAAILQMRASEMVGLRERSGPVNISYDDPRIVSRLSLPSNGNSSDQTDAGVKIADTPKAETGPDSIQSSDQDWVEQQPTGNFTIQLFASGRLNHCEDYVRQLRERYQLETHAHASARKRRIRCSVIYGSYAERVEAKAKLRQLPREIRRAKPWVRQLGELQRP